MRYLFNKLYELRHLESIERLFIGEAHEYFQNYNDGDDDVINTIPLNPIVTPNIRQSWKDLIHIAISAQLSHKLIQRELNDDRVMAYILQIPPKSYGSIGSSYFNFVDASDSDDEVEDEENEEEIERKLNTDKQTLFDFFMGE